MRSFLATWGIITAISFLVIWKYATFYTPDPFAYKGRNYAITILTGVGVIASVIGLVFTIIVKAAT